MTEVEWLTSADSWEMLKYLRSRESERKLRLFAVGCCRQIWDSLMTDRCRRAVDTAEQFADGEVTEAELRQAELMAHNSVHSTTGFGGQGPRLVKVSRGSRLEWNIAAETTRRNSWDMIEGLASLPHHSDLASLAPGLLRCVFGPNPGRIASFDSCCESLDVMSLAGTIYEDRNFDLMPILGDALEEAGCGNPEILNHCRDQGRHVRGCWVVDLILGKS
jgi:hypothetical protein